MRPQESFVEQPIRSLQTMLRVLSEDDPRLPSVVPDGIYGPTTMQAVAAFQRITGVPATGVTDQSTWDSIAAAYDKAIIRVGKAEPIEVIMNAGQVYRLGDQNPNIFLLQSILIQLSQVHQRIREPDHNGTFDGTTRDALIDFQRLSGLPESGELDKITWKHIALQYALYVHHVSNKYDENNVL